MIITGKIKKARQICAKPRSKAKVVGFVPTMGALHKGHMSLVRRANKECDFLVVSIFVNPIQFGPDEDLARYPRDFKNDEKVLKKAGVDLLFYPKPDSIYPKGFSTYVEEVNLSKMLCGKSRPGHFKGVCTVLTKLFNVIRPDIAYFGQKDYQQVQIVKRMVADLNYNIKIKTLPIIREKDNLAMSSRNSYLSLKERKESLCLYQALLVAEDLIKKGEQNPATIKAKMQGVVKSKKTTKIDYIEIVNAENLEKVNKIAGKILIALAVYVGKTRLIDNIVLNVKK